MIYLCTIPSPLWDITLRSEDNVLTWLWFVWQKYYGGKEELHHKENSDVEVFQKVKRWLDNYFKGNKPIVDFKIQAEGTEFQMKIWKYLLEIPYWTTTSYGALALKYAESKGIKKMSARGIGTAVWKNPISLIIPCHRVVWAHGALTGYAGGIDKKKKLLEIENAL